jgi:hypothetical protein
MFITGNLLPTQESGRCGIVRNIKFIQFQLTSIIIEIHHVKQFQEGHKKTS